MPLKIEKIEEPELNLTSMIDIVLLLIIFFMVGTKFSNDERSLDIELPTLSTVQPLTSLPDEMVINVLKTGQMYLGDQPIDRTRLAEELLAAKQRYADQGVVIRGDGEGSYQQIMDVVSLCKETGLNNFSLAVRVEERL